MKTKHRILSTALELFNSEGLKEVTLRKIACAIGISQGNLNYHFKTKGDIVSVLYYQLVDKMNREIDRIVREQPIISFLSESSLISMKILYEYRFITKDLYSVLDADEGLKAHYVELQKQRKQQYSFLFQNMIVEGLIRDEELEDEYDRLYERMNILGDNWINAASLFNLGNAPKVEYYHSLLFEMMYPYLTEYGKTQYIEQV